MTDRRGPFRVSASGRPWWPLDPRPSDFDIETIAHHLAMQCRYGGATRVFYSVAEHSVLVSRAVPREYALHGLLHDAAEAQVQDVIKPIKDLDAWEPVRQIEALNLAAISRQFGLTWTPGAAQAVEHYDRNIVIDECLALIENGKDYLTRKGFDLRDAIGADVIGYSPERAKVAFLLRWHELQVERGES